MKRKSYEDVKSIVESQGSVLLSDQYINNRQLLQMMCKCGEAFEKSLDNMNGNKRYMCNKCSDKIGICPKMLQTVLSRDFHKKKENCLGNQRL